MSAAGFSTAFFSTASFTGAFLVVCLLFLLRPRQGNQRNNNQRHNQSETYLTFHVDIRQHQPGSHTDIARRPWAGSEHVSISKAPADGNAKAAPMINLRRKRARTETRAVGSRVAFVQLPGDRIQADGYLRELARLIEPLVFRLTRMRLGTTPPSGSNKITPVEKSTISTGGFAGGRSGQFH